MRNIDTQKYRDTGTDDFPVWHPATTAPHGCKIMGFFEDVGWYPCAWSEVDDGWKVAYCHATFPFLECGDPELAKHDEPEWRQHVYPHEDLCWWMPFPPSDHPWRRFLDAHPVLWRTAYEEQDGRLKPVETSDLFVWAGVNKETGEVEMSDIHSFSDELKPLNDKWEWKRFRLVAAPES